MLSTGRSFRKREKKSRLIKKRLKGSYRPKSLQRPWKTWFRSRLGWTLKNLTR
jgi:hypothetical protein